MTYFNSYTSNSLTDKRAFKLMMTIHLKCRENVLITMYRRAKKGFFENRISKGLNSFGLWAVPIHFSTFWLPGKLFILFNMYI